MPRRRSNTVSRATIEEVHKLVECAQDKIKSNPVVYAGCVESSHLLGKALDKLGISWERKFGQVRTIGGETVYHCWLETNDIVIETNPSQILGLDRGALAIEKEIWQRLTGAKEESQILPRIEPTPAGHRFYEREAEQILLCYRGKKE